LQVRYIKQIKAKLSSANKIYIQGKINVSLYYHPKQDKHRIENFVREANILKPNLVFNDLSTKPINELKLHLDNVKI